MADNFEIVKRLTIFFNNCPEIESFLVFFFPALYVYLGDCNPVRLFRSEKWSSLYDYSGLYDYSEDKSNLTRINPVVAYQKKNRINPIRTIQPQINPGMGVL